MKEQLAGNISRYRKESGQTQEALADRLGITFQAVSKWETGQTMPDTALLPSLARALDISMDKLFGYSSHQQDATFYDPDYQKDAYYWGTEPSSMCLKVLKLHPPVRPLKLLDIGCGEGKDAVFFARCGYQVSAFDLSEAGLQKANRLAKQAGVPMRTFRADIWDYRPDEPYDIIFSSGVLHVIKPELRKEIIGGYKSHVNDNGIAVLQVFVEKPFIAPPPEQEKHSYPWKSGELFTCFHDWYIEQCEETVFDCTSSGVPHQHADNRLIARKKDQ